MREWQRTVAIAAAVREQMTEEAAQQRLRRAAELLELPASRAAHAAANDPSGVPEVSPSLDLSRPGKTSADDGSAAGALTGSASAVGVGGGHDAGALRRCKFLCVLLLLHHLLGFVQHAHVREVLPSTVGEAGDAAAKALLRYNRVLLQSRLEQLFAMTDISVGEAAIDVDAAWRLALSAAKLTRAWRSRSS